MRLQALYYFKSNGGDPRFGNQLLIYRMERGSKVPAGTNSIRNLAGNAAGSFRKQP